MIYYLRLPEELDDLLPDDELEPELLLEPLDDDL